MRGYREYCTLFKKEPKKRRLTYCNLFNAVGKIFPFFFGNIEISSEVKEHSLSWSRSVLTDSMSLRVW
jgi:hypothetical protein